MSELIQLTQTIAIFSAFTFIVTMGILGLVIVWYNDK